MKENASFDPRTWLGSRPESPEGSSDVSSAKSADESAKKDPSAVDKTNPETLALAEPNANQLDRRSLMGLGLGGVVLVSGGLFAHLSKPKSNQTPPDTSSLASQSSQSETATTPVVDAASTTRSLNLTGMGELEKALLANGLAPDQALAITTSAISILPISTKGDLRLVLTINTATPSPNLIKAIISRPDSSGVEIAPSSVGGFQAKALAANLSRRLRVQRGEIDTNSFYSSAVSAGITDSLIPDFARIFAYDFDFQFEIVPGDVFEAGFEEMVNDKNDVFGVPRLVYASLTTAKKSKALYLNDAKGEDGGWFDGNGQSIVRSLMRTPVDGARVTSKFGFRVHPVLGYAKLHRGTDFGAPTGTPIYASGDAKVVWAAMKGANGNLVILAHKNGWQTYYLHLNAFAPGIAAGVEVKQGQHIGDVGTTGRSTGPHLHYEIHIDGEPVDPLSIQTDAGRSLIGDSLKAFIKRRDEIDSIRAQSAV